MTSPCFATWEHCPDRPQFRWPTSTRRPAPSTLLERAKYIGDLMLSALAPLSDLPGVVEVRGAGLALGIEFDGVDAASIAQLCRQDGVIVRAGIGRIVLSPSLVITEAQAYAICTALEKHIRTATNS